jgi:hypothetical protein
MATELVSDTHRAAISIFVTAHRKTDKQQRGCAIALLTLGAGGNILRLLAVGCPHLPSQNWVRPARPVYASGLYLLARVNPCRPRDILQPRFDDVLRREMAGIHRKEHDNMATTKGTGGSGIARAGQNVKVLEFLRASKLVNLDQSIAQVISSVGSIADDIDGHLICWQAYVLIHHPHFNDLGGQREIGG